jgi:NAD(P)-dependent dehydrogenase (short-subunit alcohol dehydrogenase family)
MPTIFITGTSSWLGRVAATLFASREWRVIAAVHRPDQEAQLAKRYGILLCALDITDRSQISSAAATLMTQSGVDVVFNNAGWSMAEPREGWTAEQMLRTVSTNLMGPIRTTKAFLPFFEQRMSGLFINTTCVGAPMGAPVNLMYQAIKLAVEGWSERMAVELNPWGIGMKIVDPGGPAPDLCTCSSDLGTHADHTGDAIVEPKQLDAGAAIARIADAVYEAATDGRNQLRYVVGVNAPLTRGFRLPMETQSSPRPLR